VKNLQSISSKKIKRSTVINLEKGKIPPQAVELEEAVLGAMMIDKKGVDDVIDILHAEAFYKEAHQLIYEAIFNLFQNSEPTDLRKNGNLDLVGGDFYLVGLT
jgi:replicative DNA helicase